MDDTTAAALLRELTMMNGHLEQIAGALDRIADQYQPPPLRPRPMTEEQRQTISGMVGQLERIASTDRITGQEQSPSRPMTEEQREAITARMRQYWASRREGKARSVALPRRRPRRRLAVTGCRRSSQPRNAPPPLGASSGARWLNPTKC